MTETTVHIFSLAPPKGSMLIHNNTNWNVVCTSTQARRIAEEVEKLGWIVDVQQSIRAMSLEDLADEFGKLKVATQIGGPSPWDEYGNWTNEALREARKGAVKLYGADGKLIVPEPEIETEIPA